MRRERGEEVRLTGREVGEAAAPHIRRMRARLATTRYALALS
jgi:hypothetical protein